MLEKILLGYAGDKAGRDAAVLAAELAGLADGELTIVYPYHPLFATVPAEIEEQRVREELGALLDRDLVSRARCHWSNASWPIRALHELADYEDADVIVFGAAPVRLERRHVSLMERMVHGAPCAVALAPAGYSDRERAPKIRVGVGFADTEEGRGAILLARELAERAGASLEVIAGAGLSPALAGYASASPELAETEAKIHAEMKASAERVCGELLADTRASLEVRKGDACQLLVDASGELDLLVLGSRAYGPLHHALLGGVSACVMRGARCPVLIVPRGSARRRAPTHEGAAFPDAGR